MYTDTQKSVLLYFFTTTDTRVACATDNMPSSLWAYLIGSYSRSHEPIRDRLLNTLFNDTGLVAEDFVDAITSTGTASLASSLSLAERFLRKWAVDYGHNSLKDSATDRFAVEGCSIYAAKAFEDTELAAFQEKSTRYLSFGVHSVGDLALPSQYRSDVGDLLPDVSSAFTSVFEAYTKVLSYWEDTHFTESDPASFVNDAARRRTAKAKAFDKARYYLPTMVKTSFGATMQSRESANIISRLLAHPSDEVRTLAAEVLVEVRKVNPGLFSRVEPSYVFDGFHIVDNEVSNPGFSLGELPATYDVGSFTIETRKCASVGATVQVSVPTSICRQVAAAYAAFSARRSSTPTAFRPIANVQTSSAINLIHMHLAPDAEVDGVLSRACGNYLNDRTTRHSPVPRYLDHVQVTVDVIMDYGAFRDLQRHRDGKQDIAVFLESQGVIEFLDFDKMPVEIRAKCRSAVSELRALPVPQDSNLIPYTRLLGHPIAWTYTCSLRQLVYMTELRSQPSGHISYRVIAQHLAEIMEKYIPWLFPFLDRSADASRASAENAIQMKLNAIS